MQLFRYIKFMFLWIVVLNSSYSAAMDSVNYNNTNSSHETIFFLNDLYMHNPIYALPYYYTFSGLYDDNVRAETKFQFSFRIPVINIQRRYFLFFAYTQTSFFQNYNHESEPFRDTDYSPEFYLAYENPLTKLRHIRLGVKHTSNGERTARSRTQNQVLLSLKIDNGRNQRLKVGTVLQLWTWLNTHSQGFLHDNPDLVKYRGYADLMIYVNYSRHLFEAKVTPLIPNYDFNYNFFKPKFTLGYTFHVSQNIGVYVQYTNGYGDNIYEYNIHSNRLGIGFRFWQNP